mgnify:CR=1 FL=1
MKNLFQNSLKYLPDINGRFGEYGGRFVAETLMPLILSLSKNYNKLKKRTKRNDRESAKMHMVRFLFGIRILQD